MKKSVLILLAVIALNSCKKDNDEITPKVDSFPMSNGSEWTYEGIAISKYYESETSDNIIDIDTLDFSTKIWIEKDTVLNDTMNVKIFKTGNEEGALTEFKFIDNEGLKTYAHVVCELGMNSVYKNENLKSCLGEILVEDTPLFDIQFPLKKNSSWFYTPYVSKKVIGTENIKVKNQNYSCYKVEWNYSEDFDYGMVVTEWISEKGLIKKQTVHDKTIGYQDPEMTKTIYFQVTIIEKLTELNIK